MHDERQRGVRSNEASEEAKLGAVELAVDADRTGDPAGGVEGEVDRQVVAVDV